MSGGLSKGTFMGSSQQGAPAGSLPWPDAMSFVSPFPCGCCCRRASFPAPLPPWYLLRTTVVPVSFRATEVVDGPDPLNPRASDRGNTAGLMARTGSFRHAAVYLQRREHR